MSLAEELLADLEEGPADDYFPEDEEEDVEFGTAEQTHSEDVDMTNGGRTSTTISKTPSDSVRAVARLCDSAFMKRIMVDIDARGLNRTQVVSGPVENDPEYQLIVDANSLAVEIDNELAIIHKFCRDHYVKRFPELESLVPTAVEYVLTVKSLGNNILENSKNHDALKVFLTPATIMVLSVTASTTQGVSLNEQELDRVLESCDMTLRLSEYKRKIQKFVESRMHFIAPNLSAIVGTTVAAKLMGAAGGLTGLIKMPSCNIQILGVQRKNLAGFAMLGQHRGFIYECETVQKLPPEYRMKAAKALSAKCTLAARVDSCHESSNGEIGEKLMDEVRRKIDKLVEPPPVKQVKALPTPVDPPSKRRGGRRHRKMKERFGMTDMRKAANRMNFGEIEEDAYQNDMGFSLGNLGKSSTRGIRAPTVDAKTKARVSKALAQKLAKQSGGRSAGGATTIGGATRKALSGTASTISFTPVQGLEIVNPKANERPDDAANAKYFGTKSNFFHVGQALPGSK